MRRLLGRLTRRWIAPFVDPSRLARIRDLPAFWSDLRRYRVLARGVGDDTPIEVQPCLGDRADQTPFDAHYFHQGAWLARELAALRPRRHVDVGSSLATVAAVSAMVPTVFVDFRPLRVRVPALVPIGADARHLPFQTASLDSVSSLHVIEHIGMGRYGDPLDPHGTRRGLRELARVVAPYGNLFLSVPVGRPRVVFNAHRVLAPGALMAEVPEMAVEAFSLVDDGGHLHERVSFDLADGQDYGCGLFRLTKRG